MEGKTMTLKPLKQYKIGPNKIQLLDDVITILRNVIICVNGGEALEDLEHLIEKGDE
ncbi:hypothetical protein [Bacillus thuringiensis]|uniref:hypothetical protein n=1 Tax=Bacillus thuringiensis TaxID=1428 RepID=UPI0015D4CD81|nr:hypothetical protein [Bacillus thuringiensis]MCU4935816.1 hypothetical protein [Bacillus cereus]MCU5511205.1 hypothetical protein [Bacillus cereus]HDR4863258.1 hypothetical protein [Bacillus cereus]